MHNSVVVCGKGEEINFTIYQTPLVEDHQDPRLQREYTPSVPENDGAVLPACVPLRLHEATAATMWKPTAKYDLGADYLGADYLVAVKSSPGSLFTEEEKKRALRSKSPDFVGWSGKKVTLEQMSSADTVLNLKLRIQEQEGTSVDSQRIDFNGKKLEDERTLSDYSIGKGETVRMVKQLSGAGLGSMSALSHLSVTDNAEMSLKPEQLGPGGRIHQDFATDLEPEDWDTTETWTVRFYFFDAGQFKSKTGLDFDPADNIERQFQVDGFVEDRFPSFRGQQATVLVPSIAQLVKQSRGEVYHVSRNFDCAQNEEDAGQHGDTNEEVDPEQQMGTPRKQSRSKRFLSTLMCRTIIEDYSIFKLDKSKSRRWRPPIQEMNMIKDKADSTIDSLHALYRLHSKANAEIVERFCPPQ
ncbi:hypothetical protein Neosp_001641 [[Neocosmospora] mangrovei]